MTKNFRNLVAIKLHSEIHQDGEIEQSTDELKGEWIRRGAHEYLRYVEPKSNATTMVKWTEGHDEVLITRQGPIEVRQHFLPKEELYAIYTTPYGRFNLRTITEEIRIAVGEGVGVIQIHFHSQLNDSSLSEHQLTLLFKTLI